MIAPAATVSPPQLWSRARSRGVIIFLTFTVFFNAALMFSVEPMFSKLVLPFLGGTPSVWNTCLVFFQAALLVGYGYAHVATRFLDSQRQAILHVTVLALSCLALPLQVRADGIPPAGAGGIAWLLVLLVVSLGVPFVMLASGAPIAQRWVADSGHPRAANPYFLYAASNFGSLIALLSYPLLIEPWLSLSTQRGVWSLGYVMLVLLVSACAALLVLNRKGPDWATLPAATRAVAATPAVTTGDRARWLVYSAVPSSLLVGVTTYISTDVAAVPLLWVVPLAIYLLTFVIAFATRPWLPHPWMVRIEPHVLLAVAIPIFWNFRLPALSGIGLHLTVLFVVAMVCHGELARNKPPAAQLTAFFVWLSVGGLVGGVFNALVAPAVFDGIREYPIALVLAAMLMPGSRAGRRLELADIVFPVVVGAGLVLVTADIGAPPDAFPVLVTACFAIAVFSCRNRPVRFGLALAAVVFAGQARATVAVGRTTVLHAERSFFGVSRVVRPATARVQTLQHGTTVHGAQSLIAGRRLEPITYYHREGPIGDFFRSTTASAIPRRRVAVVGLGTGTLACYGRAGEEWTYHEIDPVVAKIARDPRFFTLLRDCPPAVKIVLGDARLTLGTAGGAARYDILILDAFSSDAIPVHLLTREAVALYFRALAPGGAIAMHISNRHLDLEPVVAAIARDLGVAALVRRDLPVPPQAQLSTGRAQSVWVALARSRNDLGGLTADKRWEQLRRRNDIKSWTDDYSNVARIFAWR
ncbi:MAG: fused MFS/spermidine synthase [Gemmatimonadaceae bacterium]